MSEKKNNKVKGITRRDFLKGLGSGAIGSAILTGGGLIPAESKAELLGPGAEKIHGTQKIELLINGKKERLTVEPRTTLLTAIRDKLHLTGTKEVCDRGQCGACTVLIDEKPMLACMMLAVDVRGKAITTVEGLSGSGKLTPVQEAFVEKDALMCGFCTPGFVMAATALLKKNPDPSLEEIKQGLAGNLCRCGTYPKVFEAVKAAAAKMRKGVAHE
ncbi:MAG: (2Fe-2S)-binding protein [Calditrichaeota bacterium]|nr:MAG: (2Fe-2S)-binding protein [Calditrichota bacterium]